MTRVFLSYRRDDSMHQVGRIYDRLERVFGRRNVFKDVDSIPPGADFRRILSEYVSGCDVVLALIGDRWLTVTGADGKRRLEQPSDFVRVELEEALSGGIPVIPVLVGREPMPTPDQLPGSLLTLAYRHAVIVRPDPDFRRDSERLIDGIRAAAGVSPRAVERLRRGYSRVARMAMGSVSLAILLGGVVAILAYRGPVIQENVREPKAANEQIAERVKFENPRREPDDVLRVSLRKAVAVTKAEKRTVHVGGVLREEEFTSTEYVFVIEEIIYENIDDIYHVSIHGQKIFVIYGKPLGTRSPIARMSYSEPIVRVVPAAKREEKVDVPEKMVPPSPPKGKPDPKPTTPD